MNKKPLFMALLILGTAFWGISFPVTKMTVTGVSQYIFLFYRFALATAVLSIVFFRSLQKTDRKSFMGGVGLALPLTFAIYFQTLGLQHTSASQCAFIAGMCVVVIPVLKLLVYRTAVALKIWVASVVALLGLFVISFTGSFSMGAGDLYTLIGCIGFAVYMIKVEHYTTSRDIIPTIVPMFLTSSLIMLGLSLTDNTANWLPEVRGFWPGVIYCALLSTAFMYTVSNISQRYISAEKVAIIYLFEPVFATLAAYAILDEVLTCRLALGGVLIFAGTLISEVNWKNLHTGNLFRKIADG